MTKKKKKHLDQLLTYLLDKVDLVFTAAYALLTQDIWLNLIKDTATVPDVAYLIIYSLALAVAWAIIGTIKSRRY